jgi:hypothetical protein
MQQLNGMQPRAILIDHGQFLSIVMPAAQESLHGGGEMRITTVKRTVELRQKECATASE